MQKQLRLGLVALAGALYVWSSAVHNAGRGQGSQGGLEGGASPAAEQPAGRLPRLEMEVVEGDITQLDVDAIANAANNRLWMGAGVAGAIKRVGGEEIEREAVAKGPIEVGEAVATGAGRLQARYVIHGAVMGQDLQTNADLVDRTTASCLQVADELGARIARAACVRDRRRRVPARRVRARSWSAPPRRSSRPRSAGRLRRLRRTTQSGPSGRRWRSPSPLPDDASARRFRHDPVRGLVCAGGEATRLQELTRVTNKHLLPVGRWPMVYYPLQLLQLAGIREVLIVTGQAARRQLIDLLGDGRVDAAGRRRSSLFDLDLTYKVQTAARWHRAGRRAWPRASPAGDEARRLPRRQPLRVRGSGAIRELRRRGRQAPPSSSRRCPTRSGSASSSTATTAGSSTSSRRRAVVDTRYAEPPSHDAVVGLYCYGRTCSRSSAASSPRSAASSRSPTSTAPTPCEAISRSHRVERLVARRRHARGAARIGALIEETGVNKRGDP